MAVAVAMSIREANQLLRNWGFALESGGNGGHAIWVRDGRRVQFPAEGRHAPVTQVMLKKAADICGVPVPQFKMGPPTIKTKPFVPELPQILDLRESHGQAINGNGNGNGHHPPGPHADDRLPSEKVWEYFKGRPQLEVKVKDMAERLGMKIPNANSALQTCMKHHPEVQKVAFGRYMFVEPKTEPSVEELHEQRLEAMRHYERIATDPHGRIILTDNAGELWVAIKVEPTFFPIKMNGAAR